MFDVSHSPKKCWSFFFGSGSVACSGLFDKMKRQKIQLDVICFGAAMSSCAKFSQWQAALALLETGRCHKKRTTICVGRQFPNHFLRGMRFSSLKSSHEESVVSFCDKTRGLHNMLFSLDLPNLQRFLNFLADFVATKETMLTCQLPPSSISFNVALHVCSMAGRWLKALQLCRTAGPAADVISYSTSISACEPWPMEHEGPGPKKNMGNQGAARGFQTTYRLECKSCQLADFRRFPPGNMSKSKQKEERRIAHLKRRGTECT